MCMIDVTHEAEAPGYVETVEMVLFYGFIYFRNGFIDFLITESS